MPMEFGVRKVFELLKCEYYYACRVIKIIKELNLTMTVYFKFTDYEATTSSQDDPSLIQIYILKS